MKILKKLLKSIAGAPGLYFCVSGAQSVVEGLLRTILYIAGDEKVYTAIDEGVLYSIFGRVHV